MPASPAQRIGLDEGSCLYPRRSRCAALREKIVLFLLFIR
jgi:hypothetical protein